MKEKLFDSVGNLVERFFDESSCYHFKKDNVARKFFNKIFGTDFKAVYRLDNEHINKIEWDDNHIDWSNETIFIVRKDNKIIRLTNSEWSSFNLIKD